MTGRKWDHPAAPGGSCEGVVAPGYERPYGPPQALGRIGGRAARRTTVVHF
jgi:hypothetical protein